MAHVLYGQTNTHSVSLKNIIQHTISVKQGIKKSLLVVDMPKNSYNSLKKAKFNAKKILNLTKCDAVKIESNKISAVIHPQSILHAMVTYIDGSSIAHLSNPSMDVPIANMLRGDNRITINFEELLTSKTAL